MNRSAALLILVIAIASACALENQAQGPQPDSSRLGKLLGKQREEIEGKLGKPKKTGADENGASWAEYMVPGTKGVRVTYDGTSRSGTMIISLEKGITWKKAAKAVGLKLTTLKPTPLTNIPSLTQLVGDPYKGWNVFFASADARYPGQGAGLINPNALPMIEFEQRSLNDTLPD